MDLKIAPLYSVQTKLSEYVLINSIWGGRRYAEIWKKHKSIAHGFTPISGKIPRFPAKIEVGRMDLKIAPLYSVRTKRSEYVLINSIWGGHRFSNLTTLYRSPCYMLPT